MKEEMDEISLFMAQDLCLIPKPNQFNDYGTVGLVFRDIRLCSESEYKQKQDMIIDRYCSDKHLLLCKFPRSKIKAAVNRFMNS